MSIRKLSVNVVASVTAVVLSAGILFELYRFLSRELGAEQIGIWSLVLASVSVVRLAEFGLGGGIARFVALDLGQEQPDRAAMTVGLASVVILLVMGTFSILLIPVFNGLLRSVIREQEPLTLGLGLVPWAAASLWLGSLCGVYIGALDGAQRAYLRSGCLVGAGLAQLGIAYYLIPIYGLPAMGVVQFAFVSFQLGALMLCTILTFRQPIAVWFRWEKARTADLLRFGGGLQIGSLAHLMFEPCTKWLLGVFGNLAAVGYFEMASRAVVQLRQLVVAGYSMLMPYVANKVGREGIDESAIRSSYYASTRLLFIVSIPFFTILTHLLPLVFNVWLGHYSEEFIRIGFLCLTGWFLGIVAVPAQTFFLALGRLKWVVGSQLLVGVLALLMSLMGGLAFGADGVIGGAMSALVLGSVPAVAAFHNSFNVVLRRTFPACTIVMLVVSGIAIALPGILGMSRGVVGLPFDWLALSFIVTAVMGVVVWFDPSTKELFRRLWRIAGTEEGAP